jgi:lipopolysaccharide transport system ATP-binding protein
MTRAEIRRKFDEIVAFAEVERFLDTPVKRYSSGMYVRLAFAVAAHLEPEILVVDEVLAVGDAEFQKKCLGKMSEVAGHGRTVLFVSHNMAAVNSLTRSALMLNRGRLVYDGPTATAIEHYSAASVEHGDRIRGGGHHASVLAVRLCDPAGQATGRYLSNQPMLVEVDFQTDGSRNLSIDLFIVDHNKAKVAMASMSHFEGLNLPPTAGAYRCRMVLEPVHLAAGQYTIDVAVAVVNNSWDHYVEDALAFETPFSNPAGLPFNFLQSYGMGFVALKPAEQTRILPLEDTVS